MGDFALRCRSRMIRSAFTKLTLYAADFDVLRVSLHLHRVKKCNEIESWYSLQSEKVPQRHQRPVGKCPGRQCEMAGSGLDYRWN